MRKLTRDKITSNGDLVGVYYEGDDGKEVLFNCVKDIADKIINMQDQIRRRNLQIKDLKKMPYFTRDELHMVNDCLDEWEKHNQANIRVEEARVKWEQTTEARAQDEIKCQKEQIDLINSIKKKLWQTR